MYRYVHFTHEYQEKGGNYADCRGNYKEICSKTTHLLCVVSLPGAPNSSLPIEHVHAVISQIPLILCLPTMPPPLVCIHASTDQQQLATQEL